MTCAFLWLSTVACLLNWAAAATTQAAIDDGTQLFCSNGYFQVYMSEQLVLDTVGPDESIILYGGSKTLCNFTGSATYDASDNNQYIYRLENGTYIFNFTYPDCGVERRYLGDNLKYEAVVGRDSYYVEGVSPIVSRIRSFEVNLDCFYSIDTNILASFQVQGEPIIDGLNGGGFLSLVMRLYKQAAFGPGASYERNYPIYVNEGDKLYFQIFEPNTEIDAASYELEPENCTLSNSTDLSNPYTKQEPILINNCPTDVFERVSSNGLANTIRFSLEAVGFFTEVQKTYVTCTLIVCEPEANDPFSRCSALRDQYNNAACTNASVADQGPLPDPVFQNYTSYISREQMTLGQIRILAVSDGSSSGESVTGQVDGAGQTLVAGGTAGGAVIATTATTTPNCEQ